MTTTLHAHVSTFARDCDGGHGHDYITRMNEEEIREHEDSVDINGCWVANDFSDIHFMQRVMVNVASPYAVEYGMTVEVDSEGIRVREQTDEGHRSAEVTWCHDDCADESRVFDEYAEAMGY